MLRRYSITTFFCALIVVGGSRAFGEVHLVADSETSAEISADTYRVKMNFAPDPNITVFSQEHGKREQIGSFPLEGFAATAGNTSSAGAARFIRATKESNHGDWLFRISYAVSGREQHLVALKFSPSFFSYSLSLRKEDPREITDLLYLAGNGHDEQVKYGQGSFEQLHTWTPDLYDVFLPDVALSRLSLPPRMGSEDPGYIRGQQAGSPLVGPYLVAVRSGCAWWGIGTIGIPNTYNGLGIVIGRSSFAVKYQTASQASAQENRLDGPTLGFYFGHNPDEILASYKTSLQLQTETTPRSSMPTWWSRPIYCTWGDQAYAARMREGLLDETHASRYGTEKDVDHWLAIADREKLPIGTIILDLGWMQGYGDFEPNPKHFSNLRAYIDKLHARGIHVLLWIPMYEATGTLFNVEKPQSEVAARHPEWLVKTRDGKLTDVFDYTNPHVREYLRSRIRYMLSSDPGALNADGFKVDFIDRLPDPAVSTFHDPSWGIGELMSAKVMEVIYTSAKQVKADALIDSSFMNPLFHAWQDVIRLNDDASNAEDTYWWRARAASTNGVRLIDGDDWWAMERYFVPLTLAKSAWGIPNIYALEYRGNLGTEISDSTASGGYPISIDANSYREVEAILNVYEHAPADNTQEPFIDPVLREAGRKYTEGPLKGSLAAQTLNFGHVLVTYDSQLAKLTSIADCEVSVRLPEGFVASSVSAVDFDGNKNKVAFKQQDHQVRFSVQDSAKGIYSYEIRYKKTRPIVHTDTKAGDSSLNRR
jgi:hypothetical protein